MSSSAAAAAVAPLSRRPADALTVAFFLLHAPLAILFDAQAVLPADWFPQVFKDATSNYIKHLHDPLVSSTPIWFKSLVWCETVIQFPFFFLAAYAFATGKQSIRIPLIMYCTHVLTTMVPIYAELWGDTSNTFENRLMLAGIYAPWALVPAWLLAKALIRGERLFDVVHGRGKRD
eukprot:jgi/Chlat1/1025/Chrsp109S01449